MTLLELIATAMIQAKVSVKSFCDRHIVADHPYPFHDVGLVELVQEVMNGNPDAQYELRLRLQRGLVSENEVTSMVQELKELK